MKVYKLDDFTKGWVVGDFEPSIIKTGYVEVGVKTYKSGDYEPKHYHQVATEITIIGSGKVRMNGIEYKSGDIIVIEQNDITDFEVLEDTVTTVIKLPSASGDKYLV
jgi:quercetin dioxygenase-like cupin family protein